MSFSKNVVTTDKAPAAVGTYSQGVEYNGVYYFSGQIGLEPVHGEMQHTFAGQLEQIMKNIDGLLEGQKLTREHIVKTTVFLTDLGNFSQVNDAYAKFFKPPFPARSTIQVSALPKGGLVEIEVIAVKG